MTDPGMRRPSASGIEMCWSYNHQHGTHFCAMPTNLYGPGDNYDFTGDPAARAAVPSASVMPPAAAPASCTTAASRTALPVSSWTSA